MTTDPENQIYYSARSDPSSGLEFSPGDARPLTGADLDAAVGGRAAGIRCQVGDIGFIQWHNSELQQDPNAERNTAATNLVLNSEARQRPSKEFHHGRIAGPTVITVDGDGYVMMSDGGGVDGGHYVRALTGQEAELLSTVASTPSVPEQSATLTFQVASGVARHLRELAVDAPDMEWFEGGGAGCRGPEAGRLRATEAGWNRALTSLDRRGLSRHELDSMTSAVRAQIAKATQSAVDADAQRDQSRTHQEQQGGIAR